MTQWRPRTRTPLTIGRVLAYRQRLGRRRAAVVYVRQSQVLEMLHHDATLTSLDAENLGSLLAHNGTTPGHTWLGFRWKVIHASR